MIELHDEPVLTAARMVAWKKKQGLLPESFGPRGVILCFQSAVIESARAVKRARRVSGLNGEVHLLGPREKIAIVRSPGPGAPAAVALLEELVALGAEQIVVIGLAGALQPTLATGDLLIPERAIRDEGTSRHYLPSETWATANPALVVALCETLVAQKHSARIGSTWTTDAPYREMQSQVQAYRQEGVDTVEMEAAALFAAGQYLNVKVAAGLVVADRLDGLRPPFEFDMARAEQGLKNLAVAAIQVLGEVE